jgi:hypothetical protein
MVTGGWNKIISDNLDTEREREREREVPAIMPFLSHLIIMAMFHTLQINVREEKALSPPPPPPTKWMTIQSKK